MSELKLPVSRFPKPYVDRSMNDEWWDVFDADGDLVMRLPCMFDLAHDPTGRKADEIIRAVNSHAALVDALRKHRHTDKCFDYAARTAARHGNAYCTAECADSWKAILAIVEPDQPTKTE